MIRNITVIMAVLTAMALILMVTSKNRASAPAVADRTQNGIWVTGYYPGWQQTLRPEDIDFNVITHLIYFSLVPKPDGTLDSTSNGLTDANAAAVVAAAHKAGRKVLVCVGGENSGPAFESAIAPGVRDVFVKNIVDWATSRGFDGVDIDMEPTKPQDASDFQAFIHELRSSLRAVNPDSLLTSAVGVTPDIYKPILDDVDQINLMSYDLAGTWPGWETWYNSCLSNGGRNFKSVAKPLPSTDQMVNAMIAGGIPASKIGIGVCENGVVWHGATGPNQPIIGVKTEGMSYNQIMEKYGKSGKYHWDEGAKAGYLSVDDKNPANRAFVAYDDEKACAAKIDYVRREHLGGVIVWELSGAYNAGGDPLLAAIGSAKTASK